MRGAHDAASHEVNRGGHGFARAHAPHPDHAFFARGREVDRVGGGAHGRLAYESSRRRRVEAHQSLSRLVHGQRGDALHGLEVPFVHDSISGARYELIRAAIGRHRHLDGGDRALVRLQNPDAFSLPERPRPHLAILGSGVELQLPGIRVEASDGHHSTVTPECVRAETLVDIPHPRGPIRGGGHEQSSRRVDPHVEHRGAVRLEGAHALTRGGVPNAASHRPRCGEHPATISGPAERRDRLSIPGKVMHHLARPHLHDVHRLVARSGDHRAIVRQPTRAAGVEHLQARLGYISLALRRLCVRHDAPSVNVSPRRLP